MTTSDMLIRLVDRPTVCSWLVTVLQLNWTHLHKITKVLTGGGQYRVRAMAVAMARLWQTVDD